MRERWRGSNSAAAPFETRQSEGSLQLHKVGPNTKSQQPARTRDRPAFLILINPRIKRGEAFERLSLRLWPREALSPIPSQSIGWTGMVGALSANKPYSKT